MKYKLGSGVAVGDRVKTENGWRLIRSIEPEAITVTDGFIAFGSLIYGWRKKRCG